MAVSYSDRVVTCNEDGSWMAVNDGPKRDHVSHDHRLSQGRYSSSLIGLLYFQYSLSG